MRKQFVKTVEGLLDHNKKLVVLLGDISVFGFRNAFQKHPTRIYNIGILEQSTISVGAGLAKTGLIPVMHTITPFIIERALEQIKVDFAFQGLGGNFISVGGSYDYASLGATHHCPADVAILKNIPEMEVVLPGTAEEFDILFKTAYANGKPTYFRISERTNKTNQKVKFGKARVIQKGKKATIIAVGPMLDTVHKAVEKEDVTLLYYTTLAPFDSATLKKNIPSGKILVCEPYYEGALDTDILNATGNKPITISHVGMPRRFITAYGKAEEHDKDLGLTVADVKKKLKKLING